ncbi:PaaI family thioesterase [Sphingomonas sp. TX0543]|uniref:PaaI family thioesterase n=1 Tax=Sphingomonas sp. TX0543 TaxID=3399682 RepID=UPI003AFB68F5
MVGETPSANPDGLAGAALQGALSIAPFHAWLGLRVEDVADGVLHLSMPWRDEIVSNPRIPSVHGGVFASLIDLAGMYVLLTRTRAVSATASLHVDYHRPASGGPLHVRARVVKIGRTLSVADSEVRSPDDVLLASGRGSYLMRDGGIAA